MLFRNIQKNILIPIEHHSAAFRMWPWMILGAVFLIMFLHMLFTAPRAFPLNERIEIAEGNSVRNIGNILDDKHVVRSQLVLQVVLGIQHPFDSIKAGVYTFAEKKNVFEIAQIITEGIDGTPLVRVTVPEGLRGRDLIRIFDKAGLQNEENLTVEDFDAHIGYLYPDTYFVPETYTYTEMRTLMQDTYQKKIETLGGVFGEYSEEEVVILASILEREANTVESKRIIAGILQTRLEIGMALQVDASFSYLLDKESAELTLDDLAIDSPYNTYLYPGLPPTPIANPGLESIEAVLSPIETEYLYYLTAPDGTFYYAETFAEHKRNKELYLW